MQNSQKKGKIIGIGIYHSSNMGLEDMETGDEKKRHPGRLHFKVAQPQAGLKKIPTGTKEE